MELHDISGGGSFESGINGGSVVWRANVTVGVHDAYHRPVNGATVNGQWSDGAGGSGSCLTGASGYCTIVKSGLSAGTTSVTFTVTGISHGGDPYLPDNNHDPDGTSVTMFKPTAATFLPLIEQQP